MRRFATYRGVAGYLVAHPTAGAAWGAPDGGFQRTGRFAGMRKLSRQELLEQHGVEEPLPADPSKKRKRLPRLDELELVDRYEPREELFDVTGVDARRTLEKAAKKGHLERLGKPFLAKDMKEALALSRPAAAPSPALPKTGVKKSKSTKGGDAS